MRIAIATDWFAPRRGGIESQLLQLATGLQARGHDVAVLTSTPGPAEIAGITVRRVPVATLPFAGVALTPGVVRAMSRAIGRGYDVVHSHVSVVSPVGYAAAVVARRHDLPVVVTFHSVLRAKRMLLRAANMLLRLDRAPVQWTAVSELVASQLRSALPRASVSVLPNGIDSRFWGGVTPAPDAARPTFVCAMRLHRKKRPVALLRAFEAAVRATGGPARLVIAGDGPQRDTLRRAASLARGTVTLLPWQDPVALRELFGRASVFVLPSRHESFGLAALEARAAGLPVIAMEGAGCVEFLRDGEDALLCAGDAALADAMAHMIRDPALRGQLASASPRLERYDWSAVLADHELAYAAASRRADGARSGPR